MRAGALTGRGGGDGYEVSMASNKWMRLDRGLDLKKCELRNAERGMGFRRKVRSAVVGAGWIARSSLVCTMQALTLVFAISFKIAY